MKHVNIKDDSILLKTNKIVRPSVKRKNLCSKCSAERIMFSYEQKGVKLYLYNDNNNYVLLKKPHGNSKNFIEVKMNSVKGREITYLNIRNLFNENVEYVNILQRSDGSGYELRPATEDEVKCNSRFFSAHEYPDGYVSLNNNISLTIFTKFLMSKDFITVEQVDEGNDLYLRLTPSDVKEHKTRRELMSEFGTKFAEKFKSFSYSYPVSSLKTFQIPNSFMKKGNIKYGDILPVWYNEEEGCCIIEAPAKKCSICGCEISRYESAHNELHTCDQIQSYIENIAEHAKKTTGTAHQKLISQRILTENQNKALSQKLDEIKDILSK